jgi:hypothetical protein
MMIPFEVLPCIEVGGLVGLWLRSDWPVEKRVADALIRLTSCPSPDWEEAASLAAEEGVSVELSLEQLALLLERLDFESGRADDIAGMAFWPNARAAMEFLERIGYEWTNDLGFDCHESYVVRWTIPEGMAGYVAWLAQHGKSVVSLPEELRYHDAKGIASATARVLRSALERHVNRRPA